MSQDFQQPPKPAGGMSVMTIVLIVIVVVLVICGGLCGGCIYSGSQAINEVAKQASRIIELAQPTTIAQQEIQSNPDIIAKFGNDITFGIPTREGTGELDTSNTHFNLPVNSAEGSSTKASGVAHIHAVMTDGIWKVMKIEVKCSDGTMIDVPPPAGDQAPSIDFGDPDLPSTDPIQIPESNN